MKKLNFLKYGLTALMMAFAMTLCFSCSSDDDEDVPSENVSSQGSKKSLAYEIKLTGRNLSEQINISNSGCLEREPRTHDVYVGDTLSLSVKPLFSTAQPKSVDAWDVLGMISFDKETNKVFIVKKYSDGQTTLTVKITDPSGKSVSGEFYLQVCENN